MNKYVNGAVIALMASISSAASAQVWIGGSFGYNHAEIEYGEQLGIDFGSATTDVFNLGVTNSLSLGMYFNL